MSYLIAQVRLDLNLKEDQALNVIIDDKIIKQGRVGRLTLDKSFDELYKLYKNADGFLYIEFSEISAFGSRVMEYTPL